MKRLPLYVILLLSAGTLSAQEVVITHKGEEIRLQADPAASLTIDPVGGAIRIELIDKEVTKLRNFLPEDAQQFKGFELSGTIQDLASGYRSTTSFQTLSRVRPLTDFSREELQIESLEIDRESIDPDLRPGIDFSEAGYASLPFAARNSLLVKLGEDITPQALSLLLAEFRFELLKVLPEIHSIHVRTDLSRFVQDDHTNAPAARLRFLADAVRFYTADPRIKAVAPDLIIDSQRLLTDIKIVDSPAAEISDWGIADVGASGLWNLPRARDGALIGMVDTGFARHEDLVFARTPLQMEKGDHGTHVAGIACARHSNGTGVRGVLPNCFVIPRAEPLVRYQGQTLDRYVHLFSQVVGDLNEITSTSDGVSVFNVSLGYNWKRNMGINPETYTARDISLIVANHGEFVISILKNAAARDMVIYSAAGNDSNGDADRRSARYASPFNWAAVEARDRGNANIAFIIEAHDRDGKRANFSNEDGHLSCPGVDILSTVTLVDEKAPPGRLYGINSGTSMATPYCAASHLLLALVRPRYTNQEIAACLLESGEATDNGVPRVRLDRALEHCPERSD